MGERGLDFDVWSPENRRRRLLEVLFGRARLERSLNPVVSLDREVE